MTMLQPQVGEAVLRADKSMINGGNNGDMAGVKGKRTMVGVFSPSPRGSSLESASPSSSIGINSEREFFTSTFGGLHRIK